MKDVGIFGYVNNKIIFLKGIQDFYFLISIYQVTMITYCPRFLHKTELRQKQAGILLFL